MTGLLLNIFRFLLYTFTVVFFDNFISIIGRDNIFNFGLLANL